jgi:predicted MFS family arabinose efflux permease
MSVSNRAIPLSDSPLLSAFAGLLTLAVAMGIGRFAFTPILPMMLEDAGLTIAQGGLLASANYAGYLIGAVSAIAIRVRSETAIRGGLVGIAITTLAMAWRGAPFEAWFAMRLLAGIASAWVLISISAWSLQTLARYRRPILGSIVFSGVGTGIALAGLSCILLLRQQAGSHHAWLALGLLSTAVGMLVWPVFRPYSGPSDGADSGATTRYCWDAESLRLVLCYGIFGFGYIIPATFLPVMAKQALQDPALFGWSWPVFGLAAALSTLSVAALNRHLSSRRIWFVCHFIMATGVALPALQSSIATVFLAALLVGGTFMVITLVAMQEAKRVAGSHAPILIAAMTAAFAAGQIAGPLSISYLFGRDGSFTLALLVGAMSMAASAFLLLGKTAKTGQ